MALLPFWLWIPATDPGPPYRKRTEQLFLDYNFVEPLNMLQLRRIYWHPLIGFRLGNVHRETHILESRSVETHPSVVLADHMAVLAGYAVCV
jgi:hypothetical protein